MKLLRDNCTPEILDGFEWVAVSEGFTCYPWQTTPAEYLEFAEKDFKGNELRSYINAIGNAKRAIHSHVDFLLHNCGRCLRESNFPKKMELLEKLGIIAPSLLDKYNRLRNVIEHKYVSPTGEQAREAIDVAHLFIEATRAYTRPLPNSMVFQSPDRRRTCVLTCNWDEQILTLTLTPAPKGQCSSCVIAAALDSEMWLRWVNRILTTIRDANDPYIRCPDEMMLTS